MPVDTIKIRGISFNPFCCYRFEQNKLNKTKQNSEKQLEKHKRALATCESPGLMDHVFNYKTTADLTIAQPTI